MTAKDEVTSFFSGKMLACPLRGQWVSFRLVDEFGEGAPYGGLTYKVIDSEGQQYNGMLDAQGAAKIENCYRGPVFISFDEPHDLSSTCHTKLIKRKFYPLPITELQIRAEETRFFHKDGFRVEHNPAQKDADEFFQVEVRDLVKHGAHLPPVANRYYPPRQSVHKAMGELGFGPEQSDQWGVVLMPNKHTVLEVRPMRALRPLLSTDDEFCALNLYQLAVMATVSYSEFGQQPAQPVDKVRFPLEPSSGNLFGEALSSFTEAWRVDAAQTTPYYPIYEDVPYSKRFEILPFDPTLYPQNNPDLGAEQEHPANQHYFDNGEGWFAGDTQAFICHHDEAILITIRGTASWTDAFRDTDAAQVPFKVGELKEGEKDTREGEGKAHRGFYNAYLSIHNFVQVYLDRFYSGQKVMICGHSLGGAIALLLAEAIRRDTAQKYDVLLYTYGAPRAGDSAFVTGASKLVHHRIVNNNDPVPSVPAPWMNTDWRVWIPGAVIGLGTAVGGLLFAGGFFQLGGDPYRHHGRQQHFMPVTFNSEMSSILWDPECELIVDAAICKLAQAELADGQDMPDRDNFLKQIIEASDHKMVVSYIPHAWATLIRWRKTWDENQKLVTDREYRFVEKSIKTLAVELKEEQARVQRTSNSPGPERGPDPIVSRLSAEYSRLNTTLGRLKTLNATKIDTVKLYGNATQSPDFDASLERWLAHEENNVKEPLAMIPSRPDDVYIRGVYQVVDPDPMVYV